jgi:hypothetical protein
MRSLSIILLFLFSLPAAATSYYCSGATKQSGSTWYYPSGATAQTGSTVYYETGATLKTGSTLYFKSGATFVTGSTMYYSSGATLKTGSTYYYSNGATLKTGSTCYYESGASMGSCPATLRVQAGLGSNDLEVVLDLKSGTLKSLSYDFTSNGRDGHVSLNGDGTIDGIEFECGSSVDAQVEQLIKDYQSLSTDQKSKARAGICR